jgi:hypothetical protein
MALVELASFPDRFAAEIAHGHLASHGIESVVFDAGLSSLGFGALTPARLMVDEDDLAAAEELLSRSGPNGAG